MTKRAKKAKPMVTITRRAAQMLKDIQAANAKDRQHVLRIDTEPEGLSLWVGPEQKEDTLVGSEDTIILRASPELSKFLVHTGIVIDCMECPEGTRLIVYMEDDPPLPDVSKTKQPRHGMQKIKK